MQLACIFVLFSTVEAKRKDAKISNVKHLKELGNIENYLKFNPLIHPNQFKGAHESLYFSPVYKSNSGNAEFEARDKLNLEVDKLRIFRKRRDIYTKSEDQKKDKPIGFLSPRDEMVYKGKYRQNALLDQAMENNFPGQNISKMYFDFESILERNLARSFPSNPQHPMYAKNDIAPPEPEIPNPDNVELFEDNSFFLKSMLPTVSNWTTCDEFAKKALFHPDDIVNKIWIPFYTWSVHGPSVAVVHTFKYPTKKMVHHYKDNYGDNIRNINWNQPKLVMTRDDEMLLIAGDRKGLFFGIPNGEVPVSVKASNMTLPVVRLRLKIVDPYLAMMYCDERYTVLMAILGEEPVTAADKVKAASTLKYRGAGKPIFRDVTVEEDIKSFREKKMQEERNKLIRIQMQYVNPDSLITIL